MGLRPGAARRSILAVLCASLLLCFLGLAFTAARSLADPPVYSPPAEGPTEPSAPEGQPSCPVLELEGFEGEDAAAGETRLLRGEVAEVCAALSARLDRLRERTWWSVAEAVRAADQRAVANERLAAIEAAVCSSASPCPVEVRGSDPLEVRDASSHEYSDRIASAVDASGEATQAWGWMLVGVVVAFFVGLMLARVVDRGT
jgi:hypothetical protein